MMLLYYSLFDFRDDFLSPDPWLFQPGDPLKMLTLHSPAMGLLSNNTH